MSSGDDAGQPAVLGFADRFVPEELRTDLDAHRRARVAVISSFGMAALFVTAQVWSGVFGTQPPEIRVAAIVGTAACLAAPWVLKLTKRAVIAGSITPFVVVTLLGVTAHFEGMGLSAPMMLAAPLVPGLAIAFLGLPGLYWFSFLVLLEAAIVIALPRLGVPRPAPMYTPLELEVAQLGALTLATGLLVFLTSVMERQRRSMELRLEQSEARHRGLLEAVPDMMLRVDRTGLALDVHLGDPRQSLPVTGSDSSRDLRELLPREIADLCVGDIEQTLRDGQLTIRELPLTLADGPRVFEMRQMPSGQEEVTVIVRDITAKKQRERELERRARHDSLTGLANRRQFRDVLVEALVEARAMPELMAVLFIDLDRFKQVNDMLGHAVGDRVLTHVGERLRRIKREGDLAARHGGDEFTVLLRRLPGPHVAEEVASRILHALLIPMEIDGAEVEIGGSIGIALHPLDGRDADQLMRCADTAMYTAKTSGGDTVQRYRPDLEVPKSEERRL
jgi:diguanylate cyclase (GGDEF)-like protein